MPGQCGHIVGTVQRHYRESAATECGQSGDTTETLLEHCVDIAVSVRAKWGDSAGTVRGLYEDSAMTVP